MVRIFPISALLFRACGCYPGMLHMDVRDVTLRTMQRMLNYGCYIWMIVMFQTKSFRKTVHSFAENNTLEGQSIYSYFPLSYIIMPIRNFLKRQFAYFAFFHCRKLYKITLFRTEQSSNIIPYRVQIRLYPIKLYPN